MTFMPAIDLRTGSRAATYQKNEVVAVEFARDNGSLQSREKAGMPASASATL